MHVEWIWEIHRLNTVWRLIGTRNVVVAVRSEPTEHPSIWNLSTHSTVKWMRRPLRTWFRAFERRISIEAKRTDIKMRREKNVNTFYLHFKSVAWNCKNEQHYSEGDVFAVVVFFSFFHRKCIGEWWADRFTIVTTQIVIYVNRFIFILV